MMVKRNDDNDDGEASNYLVRRVHPRTSSVSLAVVAVCLLLLLLLLLILLLLLLLLLLSFIHFVLIHLLLFLLFYFLLLPSKVFRLTNWCESCSEVSIPFLQANISHLIRFFILLLISFLLLVLLLICHYLVSFFLLLLMHLLFFILRTPSSSEVFRLTNCVSPIPKSPFLCFKQTFKVVRCSEA